MRRSTLALILAATFTVACGDDEPAEELEIPPPASTMRPRPDTSTADTAAGAGEAAATDPAAGDEAAAERPGQPGQARPDPARPDPARPGQAQGQAGRAPTGTGEAAAPSGQRLYTVQVAAFTSPDSAQKWTGRLSSLGLPVWMSMAELGGTTYYRVRVGAVPTVPEARRLGSILTDRFEWPVWVAPVTPADRMPEDAVAETRRVLGGD